MNPLNNVMLASLPSSELQSLLPELRLVSLSKGQTLFEMGEQPRYVYFPVGAIVSMVNDLPQGETLELLMLGKTCMVGVGAIDVPSFYRASVRVAGLAYRLPVPVLKRLRQQSPGYFAESQRRLAAVMSHISQRVACIKYHSLEQQIIRWILLSLDRQYDNDIEVTHAELAKLIGSSREMMTLALGRLAGQGHLALKRGRVQVLDRHALEQASCDCYWHAQGLTHPAR